MIDHLLRFTVPAGYSLLPAAMASTKATALLLAIALQESRCRERHQIGGPARGFWQFEKAGVRGVLTHVQSAAPLRAALTALRYDGVAPDVTACQRALEHNDTLAFVFARLLLWTLPDALPTRDDVAEGWIQYLAAWRPGKPHRATWDDCYADAWARVEMVA